MITRVSCAIHTMAMLWEKFQWILPLYMKPISLQAKASIVCSVTTAVFIDFCLKKLNVFPNILVKNKCISEFCRTNTPELKCWSSFYVNYFLRYYLMCNINLLWKELTHRGPVDLRKWAIFNTILMSPKSWLSQEDLDAGCEHSMVPVDS